MGEFNLHKNNKITSQFVVSQVVNCMSTMFMLANIFPTTPIYLLLISYRIFINYNNRTNIQRCFIQTPCGILDYLKYKPTVKKGKIGNMPWA